MNSNFFFFFLGQTTKIIFIFLLILFRNKNDKLKNPNAYYKSLAYAARLEKEMDDKDRLEKKKVGIDIDYEDSFENLYLRKLKGQMKVEDKTNYDQYLFERRKKLEKSLIR